MRRCPPSSSAFRLAAFINFAGLRVGAHRRRAGADADDAARIIIPARAALKAVPPSIRDAALGWGHQDAVGVHHVLPLATPGILTGVILGHGAGPGRDRALLLIGMVAFVKNFPSPPARGVVRPGLGAAGAGLQLDPARRPGLYRARLGAIIVCWCSCFA